MTVPELVHVTGLSRRYCWQDRVGKKRYTGTVECRSCVQRRQDEESFLIPG